MSENNSTRTENTIQITSATVADVRPTGRLRFVKRYPRRDFGGPPRLILQQEWLSFVLGSGAGTYEWIDVPVEEET